MTNASLRRNDGLARFAVTLLAERCCIPDFYHQQSMCQPSIPCNPLERVEAPLLETSNDGVDGFSATTASARGMMQRLQIWILLEDAGFS